MSMKKLLFALLMLVAVATSAQIEKPITKEI
jgi:hypothetical protein